MYLHEEENFFKNLTEQKIDERIEIKKRNQRYIITRIGNVNIMILRNISRTLSFMSCNYFHSTKEDYLNAAKKE